MRQHLSLFWYLVDMIEDSLHEIFTAAGKCGDYENGKCVEFAIAASESFPGSKIMVGSRSYLDFGDDAFCGLSHAVVEIDGKPYDAAGRDAIDDWENQWVVYPVKGVTDVSFDWSEISASDLKELSIECDNPPADEDLIDQLKERFTLEIEARSASLEGKSQQVATSPPSRTVTI